MEVFVLTIPIQFVIPMSVQIAPQDILLGIMKSQMFAVSSWSNQQISHRLDLINSISLHCISLDKCLLLPVSGPCTNNTLRWYYNYAVGRCEQFTYGMVTKTTLKLYITVYNNVVSDLTLLDLTAILLTVLTIRIYKHYLKFLL